MLYTYTQQVRWLRDKARRQGLRLVQSRTRNPRDPAWRTFLVIDVASDTLQAGGYGPNGAGLSLAEVADYLDQGEGE